jgi:FkbM family methyltransferase
MQRFFGALHRLSLAGLGYGNADPARNGEYALLERLASRWPARPQLLDVGAHSGEWSRAASRVAPGAMIFALEPSPGPYAELAASAGAGIRPFRLGLSDVAGAQTLWMPTGKPALASVHRRDLSQFGMAADAPVNVQMTTLDEFCADQGLQHIEMLKLDVEGHELAVLAGAQTTLSANRVDVIQLEFGGANLDSRTYLRDLVDTLTTYGFRVGRILRDGVTPVRREEASEIFVYCNLLAVRVGTAGLDWSDVTSTPGRGASR